VVRFPNARQRLSIPTNKKPFSGLFGLSRLFG